MDVITIDLLEALPQTFTHHRDPQGHSVSAVRLLGLEMQVNPSTRRQSPGLSQIIGSHVTLIGRMM